MRRLIFHYITYATNDAFSQEGRNMESLVKKIKSIIPRNFNFCDVGARWGIEEPWKFFRDMNRPGFSGDQII